MGWLIALGILLLIGAIRLGVSLKYDETGALVKLVLGPFRYTLLPRKKKEKEPEKPKEPKEKPQPKPQEDLPKPPQPPKPEAPAEKPKEKKGGSVTDFLPLVRVGLDLLKGFRRKLRVDILELKITLAGDDPCDLAVNYGRAWAALGDLMPNLERWFVIKKRDVEVQCDFTSEKTTIYARMQLTITLGRLLGLGLWHGVRALKAFLTIQNKRKGGAIS